MHQWNWQYVLYINAGQLNVNKQIEIEKNLSDANNSLVRTAHHNIKTGNLLLQLPWQNFGSNSQDCKIHALSVY